MKNLTFSSFLALVEEVGYALAHLARQTFRSLSEMTWPMLMVSCVALALALTILPLALTLFVVFMAVKLIVAAFIIRKQRNDKSS